MTRLGASWQYKAVLPSLPPATQNSSVAVYPGAVPHVLATAAAAGPALQGSGLHGGCHGAGSMPEARDDTLLCWRAISVLRHSWLFHTHVLTGWISDKVMIQYMSGWYLDFSSGIVSVFLARIRSFCCRGVEDEQAVPGVPACRFQGCRDYVGRD